MAVVSIPAAWRGTHGAGRRLTAASALADAAATVLFVVLGRMSHHEGSLLGGTLSTAWPFLVGLALGWAALLLLRLGPLSYRAGVLAVSSTVVFGMLLRHVAGGEGTPLTFLLVATCFVSLFLLGWRLLARLVRRRAARAAGA